MPDDRGDGDQGAGRQGASTPGDVQTTDVFQHGRQPCAGVQTTSATGGPAATRGTDGEGQGEGRGGDATPLSDCATTAATGAMAPPAWGDGAADCINGVCIAVGGAVGGEEGGCGDGGGCTAHSTIDVPVEGGTAGLAGALLGRLGKSCATGGDGGGTATHLALSALSSFLALGNFSSFLALSILSGLPMLSILSGLDTGEFSGCSSSRDVSSTCSEDSRCSDTLSSSSDDSKQTPAILALGTGAAWEG